MSRGIEEKIYQLGLAVLDELLIHRNSSKTVNVSMEDATILSDMIVHVGPHAIFTFDEKEIAPFYLEWGKSKRGETK